MDETQTEGGEKVLGKRKYRKKSEVWEHFTVKDGGDPKHPRATFNYCGEDYGCNPKMCDTTTLWNHLN